MHSAPPHHDLVLGWSALVLHDHGACIHATVAHSGGTAGSHDSSQAAAASRKGPGEHISACISTSCKWPAEWQEDVDRWGLRGWAARLHTAKAGNPQGTRQSYASTRRPRQHEQGPHHRPHYPAARTHDRVMSPKASKTGPAKQAVCQQATRGGLLCPQSQPGVH
jgi:hypothetical protein